MIEMKRWGKDHWSTLCYVETRIVDYKGVLDRDHMRGDPDLHPGLAIRRGPNGKKYPTMLRDGDKKVKDHDDWSCIEDMVEEGLLKWEGTGLNPVFVLTEKGTLIAHKLRTFKAAGGQFIDFKGMEP